MEKKNCFYEDITDKASVENAWQAGLREKGYRLLSLLGTGATSQVFCVEETESGERFACKYSRQADWLKAESDLLRQLEHPIFPRWKGFWSEPSGACLVMEYLTGGSLQKLLRRKGILTQKEAVRIMIALTEGVAYLHGRVPPVVYRDLKPSNVMIGEDGTVRLFDLGAASVGNAWRAGTPGYSAPELLRQGEPSGPSSDVYSLGILLYRMLTGVRPMSGPPALLPLRAFSRKVSYGMEEIVQGCVKEDPRQRIPDARALLSYLRPYENPSPMGVFLRELRACCSLRSPHKIFFEKNIHKTPSETDFFL